GNLTLLTHSLNTSVSNGPYSVKMPAVQAHSSLALNRELREFDDWNETTISVRGLALFATARKLWVSPTPQPDTGADGEDIVRLPPDGTACRFAYAGTQYSGNIKDGLLEVVGVERRFRSTPTTSSRPS